MGKSFSCNYSRFDGWYLKWNIKKKNTATGQTFLFIVRRWSLRAVRKVVGVVEGVQGGITNQSRWLQHAKNATSGSQSYFKTKRGTPRQQMLLQVVLKGSQD